MLHDLLGCCYATLLIFVNFLQSPFVSIEETFFRVNGYLYTLLLRQENFILWMLCWDIILISMLWIRYKSDNLQNCKCYVEDCYFPLLHFLFLIWSLTSCLQGWLDCSSQSDNWQKAGHYKLSFKGVGKSICSW